MVRVGGLIKIALMTPRTGVRSVCISITMALGTIVGNECMRAPQNIDLIMDREAGRIPTRIGRMTRRTICTDTQLLVIRIRGLVEIVQMATHALHRGTGITIDVTVHTGYRSVRTGQREIRCAMIEPDG